MATQPTPTTRPAPAPRKATPRPIPPTAPFPSPANQVITSPTLFPPSTREAGKPGKSPAD